MKKFLDIIKMMFDFHHYSESLVNKFNEGDIVYWPHEIDGCMDVTGEITGWYRTYDKESGEEYIVYDIIDIHRGYEYGDVKEKYLTLLATAEEIMEVKSPFTTEMEFKEYIKNEYGY